MSVPKIKVIKETQKLDRSKPPKSGKPKDVNFPKFFEAKTSNGITVLVIEDKRLPLVTSRFVFKSGSYSDYFAGKDKSGLASITSELLTKGTEKRSATEIAEEVDFIGATISAGCDYDASYVSSYSLKKHFDKIFEISADVILNPIFDEEEIARTREQRISSLLSMIDDGDYLSEKVFKKQVFLNSPYAMPAEGFESSIEGITKDDIKSFYEKAFVPENLIAAFVGDITPDEAMIKVNENFASWNKKSANQAESLTPSTAGSSKVYLIEKKGAVQSSLKVGHIGIRRDNPDFIAISVMNTLLGGYFTSRINKNLREVNGYTYGARSSFNPYKYSGDFSVVTEIKNDLTADATREILKELNDIRNEFVSGDELQNVKNYISGNFPMRLETPNAIASKVINIKQYDLADDYFNTYIKKVNELTKEDIKNAAEKYLYPSNLIISAAGNVNEIAESMKQFGEVNVTEKLF